jgi:hypothetical protein
MYQTLSQMTSPAVFPWIALVMGLCIGSFLNVVIHRLPRMMEREWQDAFRLMDEDVDGTVTTTALGVVIRARGQAAAVRAHAARAVAVQAARRARRPGAIGLGARGERDERGERGDAPDRAQGTQAHHPAVTTKLTMRPGTKTTLRSV